MRIGILGNVNSWYVKDLTRAAEQHEVVALPFSRLGGTVSTDSSFRLNSDEAAVDVDRMLVRSMPPGSLEQVVLRMDLLHQLEAAGTPVLNPPRTLECAIDKFLTTAKLAAAGLPTPTTLACQTHEAALAAFEQLGGDVVVKPIFGGEGRGILRLSDSDLAYRVFTTLERLQTVIYMQPFVEHQGWDIRILLLGELMFAMRRSSKDFRTNVGRGATVEPVTPSDEWIELARRAADVVGAPFVGVDILVDQQDQPYVLEVNAVPGWRALAQCLDVDIAGEVIRFLEQRTL